MQKKQTYKLVLEYEGSSCSGFQKQDGKITVQQVLEESLSKLFNQPMKIGAASGRTDTGVHACAQVVHFSVATKIPEAKIRNGLNFYLPLWAAVKTVQKKPEKFHARFDARWKMYRYDIWNDSVRSPIRAAQSWHVPYPLDLNLIKQAANKLKGEHDFRSFCATDTSRKLGSTVRTIRSFKVSKKGSLIQISVEANGFLYHMVRNLVGFLIEIGRKKRSLRDLEEVLKSKDRKRAAATAPAHGLFLVRVTY